MSTGFTFPFGSLENLGPVPSDLPCRKCSYNLRGLPAEGRCPECGTPVGLSLHGDLLRYSDPRWLDMLRQGIKLMLIGIGIVVLAAIANAVSGAARHRSVVPTLASWAGNITTLIGTWLLTSPDPSGLGEERYGKARKLVRVALIADLIGSFVIFANLSGPPSPGMAMFIGIATFISGALALIGYIAQLYYLERLALRIPDDGLAARAHFLTWAFAFSYGSILVIGLILALAIGAGGIGGGVMFFGCGIGIAGIALIIFYVMYIFMLMRAGKAIGLLADVARGRWIRAGSLDPPAP